jgi:hypothetical protein
MNDEPRKFLRQLVHQAIHSSITSVIWRLPTLAVLVLLALLVGVVFYFGLY